MSLTINPTITPEQFAVDLQTIRDAERNSDDVRKNWQVLHDFFKDKTVADDEKMRWTYFRLYTEYTWQLLSTLGQDVVILALARQVPTALFLDVDVWREFMWYLDLRTKDKDDQLVFYTKARKAFLESSSIVGREKNKPILVKDVVLQFKKVNSPNVNSLESADIMARTNALFTDAGDPLTSQYAYTTSDKAFDFFVGLINFFLGVEPEDIWYAVDGFTTPEKYEDMAKQIEVAKKQVNQVEGEKIPTKDAVDISEQKNNSESSAKPTHFEIKTMIEARFAKSADGQFVNIEGVLSLLDTLANEYNDPEIRELYFFNESAGAFQWNDALTQS